ncbi:MAG TPA: hypothetical protein VN345_19355, partial [Blastocatellia bacterium]|nr:hypothetical protein [Blastocatellia bacterium]
PGRACPMKFFFDFVICIRGGASESLEDRANPVAQSREQSGGGAAIDRRHPSYSGGAATAARD